MVDLVPAPDTLGLSSPALGPWFRHSDTNVTLPTLPLPDADLSLPLSLGTDMQWRTPAVATRSYLFASDPRPPALRGLRKEDGSHAFTDGNLVVLLTLLPEAELRLWSLSQIIPSPDGSPAPPANQPARPRVRWLAMEVPAASAASMADIENLRGADLPADLSSDADKAAFLGLDSSAGLANAKEPVHELRQPETPSAVALQNRSGTALNVNLWCFDYRGRPLDPGAVANWWTFMAQPDNWGNLWADDEETEPLTAAVTAGRVVHLTNAHEGPIDPPLLNRLNLNDLNRTDDSTALYQADANPAITLTEAADADTDSAPLPRLAALPLGHYAPPATATPFAGWTGGSFPAGITRDFLRISCVDIEKHIVGLARTAGTPQADPRQRLSAARNTAANPVLATSDAVTGQIMTTLDAAANGIAMAPVMDRLWGQTTPPADFGTDDLPDALDFSVRALAGEGQTSAGGSVAEQRVAVHFEGSLPPGGWVRLWTHGLDTQSGRRFRQHGGAALADANGDAWLVAAVPDGAAAPTAPDADPVPLSCDALVIADGQSRYYPELRFDRPATIDGSQFSLAAPPDIPAGITLWLCEQGAAMNRGTGQYASGQTLLAIPDDANAAPQRVDLASLDASDLAASTLPNAASAGDTLVITTPAFGQTPDGDLEAAGSAATLVKRERNGLSEVATMGRPAPSQERRELAAYDAEGASGVIGATPGRAAYHESPPMQLGHPGVPAAAEIHGPGAALAGPAADALRQPMAERRADNLLDFVTHTSVPVTATPDPGGTTTWAAVLETGTYGVAGDAAIRALLANNPGFQPGQSWLNLKSQIETAVENQTGQPVDLDTIIDTNTFDDDALAAALDRMILNTRDGNAHFATALQAAIERAEDFLYLETPAIDAMTASPGGIDLLGAIQAHWAERPELRVLLCVPEKYLPDQTAKLEDVRSAGVRAALSALRTAGSDRVQLFSPVAGPGRPGYLASTSVIVDDALMLTGSTHLWRRGLTFDSSLAVGLFDENVAVGRPAAVRAARQQLLANALGLPLNFLPDDPEDCLDAITQLNASGGLGRVDPGAYLAGGDNAPSSTDMDIWNPNGRPNGTSDWLTFFAALTGDASTEFNNAIR
ncbi:hypothetical protein QWY79_05240 [Halomonas sabkhae]|uniref:hypothetical protein n=1 Tax=Halomonas sabkhae TaxID=626223 RepID=UPI0025B46515|nr:hypothetical protein [Halomonas sabkhae]MDN3524669.1 hypothetical protein [Halomonas sabkhae]